MSDSFDSIIDKLRAVGEPTRLRIIALLRNSEMVAQEITTILGQSQPRVSNHLRLLCEAGLIEKRAEGSWVFHKLSESETNKALMSNILALINPYDAQIIKDTEKYSEIVKKREDQAKAYFERIAPEWDKLRALHQPEEGVTIALKKSIENQKFNFHLDLGSGLGSVLEALTEFADVSEGIDRSHQMLAMARLRLETFGDNIRVRHGDILNLPHGDESADLITIHQVLHYLEDPKSALKEAIRILSTNGVLLIAEFAPHENEELRTKFGHKRLGISVDDLKSWCMNLGLLFENVELVGNGPTENHKNALKVNVFKFIKPIKPFKLDAPIIARDFA